MGENVKRKKQLRSTLAAVLLPVVAVLVLLFFFSALSNLTSGQAGEEKQQLEDALRRATVACYAAEGVYPPSLAYLQEHYGVQVNERRFIVDYQPIADNLMPDITIMERMR